MNVLEEFQRAIEIERVKNLEDFQELMNLPLDERVAKGVTMSNITVEFEFFDGLPNQWCSFLNSPSKYIRSAKIICDKNISKFKEGSTVVLSNRNIQFEMQIDEDSVNNFILAPNDFTVKYCYLDSTNYPKNNWEINKVNTDIGTRLLLTAANVLKNDYSVLQKIENFLNGNTNNGLANYSHAVQYLNNSQNKALSKAINSSNFCLIQGPPGTGKTETIANITNHLVDKGLKVFITAPTHTAINNCLSAISSKIKDSKKIIKIGEKAQCKDIQKNEYITKKTRLQYHTYLGSNAFSQQGIAVGATPYSLCYDTTKRLRNWRFDVCIVDEASQLSIPLSIAAMMRTDKYIFVGDHKQLDPIVPSDSNNEMFAESIFGRLARIYPNAINLLNTSYRLNDSLISIPNTLFYSNLLQADSSTRVDFFEYNGIHSQILNSDSHILVNHNIFDGYARSPYEAKLVSELVLDLLENGVNLKQIGIMSPYRAQVREIKKEIKRKLPSSIHKPFDELFVDTVDSMQGQERDYIIYSMTNTNPLESKRRLGFFYSPNRLNVAITRSIKKCIVIANYKVFDFDNDSFLEHEEYQKLKSKLEAFKEYSNLSTKITLNEVDDDEW